MSDPTIRPAGHRAGLPAARSAVERLWPSVSVWLAMLVMAGFCGIVALPFGGAAGLATFGLSVVVMGGLLLTASPVVGVRNQEFVARRAHIPLDLLGQVTVLDAGEMRRAAGPGLDARAYLCLRGWVHVGLRLDLVDPQDPTPYWLISARHPERLLGAIQDHRRAG